MRHSRRTILTTDDVDSALKLRNVDVSHNLFSDMSTFEEVF